jgi:hypothetical protein
MPLYLVLVPYDLCCTLANYHTRSHGVPGCNARHNRSIGKAKVVDAVNLEIAINDGHRVPSHLGGRRLMPKAHRPIADVVCQRCPFQFARQNLPLKEWTQCVDIAYFSTKFYAR